MLRRAGKVALRAPRTRGDGERAFSSLWLARSIRLSPQVPPAGADPEQTTALALRPQTAVDPTWQRFWLTLESAPWRTLALIPAGVGGPPDLTLSLAVTLSRTGMAHLGGPVLVADGTQVPLRQLNSFLADIRECTDAGQRVLLALAPASADATTIAIARTVDRVVLCVLLGNMLSNEAKRTIQLIGPSKFLGSVIIHPSKLDNVTPK